jgi:uncharacterized protein YkwD/uncharacterized membrane protein required for colicin V production
MPPIIALKLHAYKSTGAIIIVMDIGLFITSFSIPFLGLNWLDILILIILLFYAFEGFSLGFLLATIDFVSFILSFILGIALYSKIASIIVTTFKISQGFANAIGFFLGAAFFEILLNFFLKTFVAGVPFLNKEPKNSNLKFLSQLLGIVPGVLSGLVLCSFILSLIVTLPFSVFLKHSVSNSKIGNVLVANTQSFSKNWNGIFGGAVNDALSFLTVEPQSNQTVDLHFKVSNTTVDNQAEQQMFKLVNNERNSRGIDVLAYDKSLSQVGRNHCRDMFKRGYFSHYTPEGASPFDRMITSQISFNYAGENLALAPNVSLAMNGLMESPGHKANILSANFRKMGIGVIDGGVYGQMYCQEFTD